MISKRLDIEVPMDLYVLSTRFKDGGHDLYLVGGAVRDALLNKQPKDFDLATDANPDRVIEIISTFAHATIIAVGKAFGVIKAIFRSGFECEIATFRQDIGSGRRPESVIFSTIEEDVKRRDLTINALFWDIHSGEVVDLVGGINDIEDGIIRAVDDPNERFQEDKLRILRAVRFAAQLPGELHSETCKAIRKHPYLDGVSAERIRDEFLKGIKNAHSVTHFLNLVDRFNLWEEVLPGLSVVNDMVREIRNPVILLALLLFGNPIRARQRGAPETTLHLSERRNNDDVLNRHSVEYVLNKLKYTSNEVEQIVFLLSFVWFDIDSACKLHKSWVKSKLNQRDVERFADLHGLTTKDDKSFVEAFFKYKPSINAQDLMNEGFTGKQLGVELERRESLLFSELFNEIKAQKEGSC